MSHMEAVSTYKRGTPLRANSNQHKEDLEVIRNASRPLEKADRLVNQRSEDKLIAQVDAMLFDLQGRKKRYNYNQAAAQQLEHLCQSPLDPHTQVPLWLHLLQLTNGKTVDRETFMASAVAILRQHDLCDPADHYPSPLDLIPKREATQWTFQLPP